MPYALKRDRYDNQMKRWKDRKAAAVALKGGVCEDCKELYPPEVFDFHHLVPTEKLYNWTKLRLRPWSDVVEELEKCVLLCANCHRLRHLALSS